MTSGIDRPRVCVACGKKLNLEMRDEARFHAPVCKAAWYYARTKLRQTLAGELERTLGAAQGAWYRLAIRLPSGEVRIYPPQNKPYPRFDRRRRATLGFRLEPFEPPMVPISGSYGVVFLDEKGQRLDPPSGLGAVLVDPLPRRYPPRIEAGEIFDS